MKQSWQARVWAEFRMGNLTRAARDVLLTLATYRGTGAFCVPSHATLAERARCCVRTVQRGLEAARNLGLVDWHERRVRRGWRWLRTSNSYRLTVPVDQAAPIARPVWRPARTTGQAVRGGEKETKKEALQAALAAAARLPDLLALRRAGFERQQKEAYKRERPLPHVLMVS